MPNRVLQDYIRQVNRRLGHLPGPLRRRVVSEIIAHVVLETANLQRKNAGMEAATATQQVIEGFCPPEEILVAYGPQGGIVRRSTGNLVLRSRTLVGDKSGRGRTFFLAGAAAAGLLVLAAFGMALVNLVAPGPDPVDVHEVDGLLAERSGIGLTGTEAVAFTLVGDGPFWLDLAVASDEGCLGARLLAPDGTVVEDAWDDCLDGTTSWQAPTPGEWTLEVRYTGFSGAWRLDVTA